MRVELIDRFTGRLLGTLTLGPDGVVAADAGARWVVEQPLHVTWPGPDGKLRWLTPADGEDYLRGVERELGRGTYTTALFVAVEGDEGARCPDLGRLPPQHPDDPSFLRPHVLPRRRASPPGDPPE